MSLPLAQIPAGMRYFVGSGARLRRRVEDAAMRTFDDWTYEEIVAPLLDYYSLFERGLGAEQAQRAFRFMDSDGQLLALRPDVTSSVARAAATLLSRRTRPLRLCYTAPVFLQQPSSHIRSQRETTQVGCELLGAGTLAADLEVLLALVNLLQRLKLPRGFRITLNHVGVLNGATAMLALDQDQRSTILRLADSRNRTELQRYLLGLDASGTDLAELVQLNGDARVLDQAMILCNQQSRAALSQLSTLWGALESAGTAHLFEIDLGGVRAVDYYTGLMFDVYLEGVGARIGGGGRYDNLLTNFGSAEPAVGFMLDLDLLTQALADSAKDIEDIDTTSAAAEQDRQLVELRGLQAAVLAFSSAAASE